MLLHQPAQVFARQRPVIDGADIILMVTDFPGLADRNARRQGLVIKLFELAIAPDAFFEDGLKRQWIQHAAKVSVWEEILSRESPSRPYKFPRLRIVWSLGFEFSF